MNDPITLLLRQHDPAAGKALSEFDRTRVLHRAAEHRVRRPRSLAPALLATLALFVFALVSLRREPHAVAVPASRAEVRQIQYATPGGTRIIWTLDPNFRSEALR